MLKTLKGVYNRNNRNNRGEFSTSIKIVNYEVESFPELRFIGKRYTDEDRINGSFGSKWGLWYQEDLFSPLEKLSPVIQNGDAYIGIMRYSNGIFEYWIGMFFTPDTHVLDGYESFEIAKSDFGICHIYGNPSDGSLYGMHAHDMCVDKIKENDRVVSKEMICFERYNCPRFTTPDSAGNVILDYGISLLATTE